MTKLAVQNVGPIHKGLGEDHYFDFDGVTIFTGTQGSGKSTVAKLYSSLTWLEKALERGELQDVEVIDYTYFINEVISYHGLEGYFSKESKFEYQGSSYTFILASKKFSVRKSSQQYYLSPKIMYVPAERNFLAAIDRPELISKLPRSLKDFLSEYVAAKEKLADGRAPLNLNEVYFEYQEDSKDSYISGKGYKINLLNASSGYQSYVPMVLVTRYLAKVLFDHDADLTKGLSVDQERRFIKELSSLIENLSSEGLKSKGQKNNLQKLVQQVARRYINSRFVNIVEEPEQNLFPTSQKHALFELLIANGTNSNNRLLITTHSPFITNYMNVSLKAYAVFQTKLTSSAKERLNSICPEGAAVSPEKTHVYEFQSDGTVTALDKDYGLISDDNQLNLELSALNEQFSELLDF